jgi:hypothetical protein
MKTLFTFFGLFLFSIQAYSQNVNNIEVTKEMICRGAAISIVQNVHPFLDYDIPKSELEEIAEELVREPIRDSPNKAYNLLKTGKTKEEVIEILYNDFMKLDDSVIFSYLIKADPEDY